VKTYAYKLKATFNEHAKAKKTKYAAEIRKEERAIADKRVEERRLRVWT
jgi:hypothetical protein